MSPPDPAHLALLLQPGRLGQPLVLASTEECPTRPFCQAGLEATYGLQFSSSLPTGFSTPQTKSAVQGGEAQLGLVGTTDATLEQFDLVLLEDDRGLQLADNLVPAVTALRDTFAEKGAKGADVILVGRTHLQDATPITLEQVFSGWIAQLDEALEGVRRSLPGLYALALALFLVGTWVVVTLPNVVPAS